MHPKLRSPLLVTFLLATLGLAPAASAEDAPWPAPFSSCPVGVVTNPDTGAKVTTCIAAVGKGGSFRLGTSTVTLTPGTNLQGGLGVGPSGAMMVPALDGMTLTGPAQSVPGGLLGVQGLENLLPGVTDIGAVVTLVGEPGFELGRDIHITLPVQVQLKNPLLGPDCAIGSAEDPIVLHLTTGTTTPPEGVEPLTGTPGTLTQPPLGASVLEFVGQTVVDNTFAVPAASGCGLLNLLDPIVNARSGLPAAPGVSSATLVTNSFLVAADDVGNVSGYTPDM
jgi:hypothetical protein